MQAQFHKLFTLSIDHPYFNQGNSINAFKIDEILGYQGILVRQQGNDWVFITQEKPSEAWAKPITIALYTIDPYFFQYTNLALELPDGTHPNIRPSRAWQQKLIWLPSSLTQEAKWTASQNQAIPLQETPFTVIVDKEELLQDDDHSPMQDLPKHVVIVDESKGETELPIPENSPHLAIDLADEAAGGYELVVEWKDDTKETYKFLSFPYHRHDFPLALIQLSTQQLIHEDENGEEQWTSPAFQLSFPLRSLVRRYYFTCRREEEWDQMKISVKGDTAPEITFIREPDPIQLPNGEQATVFRTKRAQPLLERPSFQLELTGKDLSIHLPLPSPINIGMRTDSPGNNTYTLEVFVQL